MISLDTNVVVRFLTGDDEEQAGRATRLLAQHPLWLTKTVLLETERVLRFSYSFKREAIHGAFSRLLGLDRLTVEDPPAVTSALAWYRSGMDFADALHLASSQEVDSFATFDEDLRKKAGSVGAVPQVIQP